MAEVPGARRIVVQGLASGNGGTGVRACTSVSSSSSLSSVVDVDRKESVVRLPVPEVAAVAPTVAPMVVEVVKRKRGRPPRIPASAAAAVAAVASSEAVAAVAVASKRVKKEDEDVCFICFDGGSLVLCDRRECPKAYHPACVKRDEAFFRPNIRWECGWHLCNICQRNAIFMCYTCPYSLCKGCVKQADIFRVRGNKGFCKTCMSTIMLIEKIPQDNKELVHVDFDDTANWEYLFKMYWLFLKEKESLTLDELTRAANPWKATGIENKDTFKPKTHDPCSSKASELSSSSALEGNASKRRKTRRQQEPLYLDSQKIVKAESKIDGLLGQPDWASRELLEFVAHMKNGDTSVVPQFDVQSLLLDYIRKNNLRDPRRKCQIICDKRLESLFGKDRIGHFEMLKLLEYHFKEESRTNGVVHGAAMDPLPGQVVEGLEIQISSRETCRSKGDNKGRQNNLDGYAAINGHNINLIYLKRGLLETLTAHTESFHDRVVGSVVRIKISSSDQKQDMHRLVRIIGTSKATQPYSIGGKMENFMLKVLNLNKIEDVSIDAISDEEFSEDECRRLRQSIKLGLVERLTVAEIQKKAVALQAARVDRLLETEMERLNLLRDRANEMGHRKELREYVEKIDLLKTPEERQRRIHEVPEVHADPRMDPSYGSDDDSGDSDMRRDGASTPKHPKSRAKSMESISPLRVRDTSKDDKDMRFKPAAMSGVCRRKHSTKLERGGVNGVVGSPKPSQEIERADDSARVPKIESQADTSIASGDHTIKTNGSISQAISDPSMTKSQGTLLVSDISELEKIWHYRDPAGKVQGPFCALQLRKWNSSGYFPSDLRVWKTNETSDRSILLTDALTKQQSSESQFLQHSCLHDGSKLDDEKVDSIGAMSSNSVAPSITDQGNEECSETNSTGVASTPEANEQFVNGYSCQPDSDGQGGAGQSSVENLKAKLIESLFNIEEPSPDATVNRSPETTHVDPKSDPLHLSCATTRSDYVDAKSQAVESPPSSQDACRPDSGTSLPIASELPGSKLISDNEMQNRRVDDELHDKSDVCFVPTENKDMNCHDGDKKHCTGSGDEHDSRIRSTVSSATNVSVLLSAPQKGDSETLGSYISENRHPVSANFLGEDTKANIAENKCNSASNIPKQVSGASWSTIFGGVKVSDLPSTSPMTDTHCSRSPITENEVTTGGVEVENNHCPPQHVHGNPCIDWDTASSLGDEVHLPDVANEWGMYSTLHVKPCDVEFHSSLVSCSLPKVGEAPIDANCDLTNWQPIEFSVLGDDSVSDLLKEVEAMESMNHMPSPNLRMNCGDDSIGSPGDDCFSPLGLGGLSLHIDPGKNDALTSTYMLPNHRDQHPESFDIDVCDIPRISSIFSTLAPEPSPVSKQVIAPMPLHNFFSQAPLSPPLPSSVAPHNFVSEAPLSLLPALPLSSPPQTLSITKTTLQAAALSFSQLLPPEVDKPFSPPHLSSVVAKTPSSQSPPATEPSPSPPPLPPPLPAMSPMPPPPPPSPTKSPPPPPPPTTKSSTLPPIPPTTKSPTPPPPPPTTKSPSPPPPPPPTKSPPPPPPPTPTTKSPAPPPPSTTKSPPPPPPTTKSPPVPSPPQTDKPLPPLQVSFVSSNPPSIGLPPPSTTAKSPSPLPSLSASEKLPLPPPRPSRLGVDYPASPQEEGEMEPTRIPVRHQRSQQTASTPDEHFSKQGYQSTSRRDPPVQPVGTISGSGSILGIPYVHWSNSVPTTPVVVPNSHWNIPVASQGTRASQTSPRYSSNNGNHPLPKDRSHHHHGVDSGFGKNRAVSKNRQFAYGVGGVPSRPPPPRRQQPICRYYERGNCNKGASCKYLHP